MIKGAVAVAVPAYGPPTWGLLKSLLALQGPDGAGWSFTMVEKLGVEQARDVLAVRFLAGQAEWLLFVDADATLHPRTIERLLSWGQPMVAALAFTRTPPPQPTIYVGERPDQEEGLPEFRIRVEEDAGVVAALAAVVAERAGDDRATAGGCADGGGVHGDALHVDPPQRL